MHADNVTAFGGGSSLAMWDLPSEERKAKYTGHPVRLQTLFRHFVPDIPTLLPNHEHDRGCPQSRLSTTT